MGTVPDDIEAEVYKSIVLPMDNTNASASIRLQFMTSVLELTSLENYYLEANVTPLRLFSVRGHCGIEENRSTLVLCSPWLWLQHFSCKLPIEGSGLGGLWTGTLWSLGLEWEGNSSTSTQLHRGHI